ncbi:hypothetical protein A7U60_g8866 [Sanghuangporus baumii]|uniref:Uncharacterized protein n=1 Tax=Sanghuangporus baumii TaxID=108892 RepID=A0A9Q5HQM3_SANBA|nr:hypothetical protein A7U60_g8866 [Sanghuangporus baumii]
MRSNTQSPISNQSSKRKRTMTGASNRGSPIFTQNQQEGMQHTPNPRLRKQVRQAVMLPEQAHDALVEVSLGSPPRSGGPSRRHVQADLPVTPTRKGQTRGRSVELAPQSPHAANPNADYIPPSRLAVSPRGVSVRRRSVTPIPPYEPPKERYTPPREVVVSPPVAERKPTRRATTKKKRVTVKTEKPPVQLWVKTEPPEVDLTTPAPPASPGDDPILLVGPPSIRVQRASLPPSDSREASFVDFEMDITLPEYGIRSGSREARNENAVDAPAVSSSAIPPAFDFSKLDDGGSANSDQANSSTEVDFGTVLDDNGFSNVYDDGWADSDSDNENVEENASIGEGDFTGKFSEFKAPLKLDPPENGDDRMEKWARPISPHPKRLSLLEPKEEEVDVGLDDISDQASGQTGVDDSSTSFDSSVIICEPEAAERVNASPGYADRRGRRLTLSEVEAIKFGPNSSPPASADVAENGAAHEILGDGVGDDSFEYEGDSQIRDESMQAQVHQARTILDRTSILDKNSEDHFDSTHIMNNTYRQEHSPTDEENDAFSARSASEHSSGESQTTLNNPDITGPEYQIGNGQDVHLLKYGKDTTQDELVTRGASLLREPSPPNHQISDCETEIATEEDPDGDSEGGASDLSVVKIMSDDPMAAARAAAILKMHDYDMVARRLRRRKTTSGGISKAYSTPKNMQTWRRRTVAGLTAEDVLSANISLPELLEKAEDELRRSPTRSRSGSVALSSVGSPQKSGWGNGFMHENVDEPGIREWTKTDWKLLDSCFTDERYDLAEQLSLELGSLADVDDVPLESVVERFIELMGGAEIVASHGPSWTMEKLTVRTKALCKRQRSGNGAPPTPDVSARFSTPSRFATLSPTPSMIVPDFTPAFAGRTRLFDSGSVSRKAMLPPPSSESFFKVPSTLPARHSRLRQDVTSDVLETPKPSRALDLFGFATPSRNVQYQQQRQDDSDDESIAQEVDAMLTPITASRVRQSRPESAVKRSLSYISSWLKPDMYATKKEEPKEPQFPGLPVPPEDLLSKPRGPVETPAPKAAPKPVPHKDLVSLEHVPPPQPTRIPRAQRPRRLVDLNHVPTPQPKDGAKKKTISRRSSVKDLIKEFEEKEKVKGPALAPPRVAELRRQGSVNSLKGKEKPTWRP